MKQCPVCLENTLRVVDGSEGEVGWLQCCAAGCAFMFTGAGRIVGRWVDGKFKFEEVDSADGV